MDYGLRKNGQFYFKELISHFDYFAAEVTARMSLLQKSWVIVFEMAAIFVRIVLHVNNVRVLKIVLIVLINCKYLLVNLTLPLH